MQQLEPESSNALSGQGYVYALWGKDGEARRKVKELEAMSARQYEDIDVRRESGDDSSPGPATGQEGASPRQGFLLSAGGGGFFGGLTGGTSSGCGAIWAGWLLGEECWRAAF